MLNNHCSLPEYPQKSDMWDKLSKEKRPIVIYGMGNGADKLISRFEKLNIKYSDIFASDGFVRGHSFHGVRVKSFSEIKEEYSDFVIVLSFATNRSEVIEMLSEINSRYDMYVPDMPVAGEEYFDRNFYNANYEKIKSAYSLLKDEKSKKLFCSVINYKLSGKMEYLLTDTVDKGELYALLNSRKDIKRIIDGGAYNGDTVLEAVEYFPSLQSALAIEPDSKNFSRFLKKTKDLKGVGIKAVNAALWSMCDMGAFSSSGNRNSSVNSTASFEHKSSEIKLITVDSLNEKAVDYIKYDVEGAEKEALVGSYKTLMTERPVLLVSVYHRSADIFSLPIYLKENFSFYDFYLRRLPCLPAWELDLIAIPKKEDSCIEKCSEL